MRHDNGGRAYGTYRYFPLAIGLSVLVLMSGCSSKVDDKFSAETYDEYTQPLTNAVIGTPTGVITVPASHPGGGAPGPVPPPPPSADGGAGGIGGIGGIGSSGGGSSSGGPFPDAGPAMDGGGGSGGGFGFWHFDDCSPNSHFLIDSSGNGANAQHALQAACVPGISGLGVELRTTKDVVQVPDEPQLTVGTRVAVAAWVHPTSVSGNQPIVIKRLNSQTSFSLGIHNGNIEMSVVLSTGLTVISQVPIAAGTWTHVAGMFDGTFVFLFINGQQFGQVFAAGTLRDVFAPIRIGATTQTQHFNGVIDEVFLSTEAISKDQLTALACIHRPTTLMVKPTTSGPVPFNTTVHYDVAVSDNDVGACQPAQVDMFFDSFDSNISTVFDFPPGQFQVVNQGATATFGIEVTGSDSADPGVHQLPFIVDVSGGPPNFTFEQIPGSLTYELAAPTGCFVSTRRELMITDTSVVDDPVRTFGVSMPGGGFDGGGGGSVEAGAKRSPSTSAVSGAGSLVAADGGTSSSTGVWTFGHLMRELAPTPESAPAMTLQLFQHWLSPQTVNTFTVAARPAIQQVLLDIWPKTAAGELDLDRPPLTLQAIVNRIDIRNLASGSAGEGRFIFAVNGNGFPQSFTVILEYNLPATTQAGVQAWANLWHGLSSNPFPSEAYNAALEKITRSFSDRNTAPPGSINGSNLIELRTNEIALSFEWELRAFQLSSALSHFFEETTVKETPDLSFLNTSTFAAFVNANAANIIAELPGANDGTVPPLFSPQPTLPPQPFLAGSVFNRQVEWNGPGILNPDARFHASENTCNGCHGPETGTFNFTMVTPRSAGIEARLSPFLTGTTVRDRFSGQVRTLNDLARRRTDLTGLVCPTDAGPPPPVEAGLPPDAAPDFDAGLPPSDAGLVSP